MGLTKKYTQRVLDHRVKIQERVIKLQQNHSEAGDGKQLYIPCS